MTNTDDHESKLPSSMKKPKTARCGSSANGMMMNLADKYLLYGGAGGGGGAANSIIGKTSIRGFLDLLHEKIRSLTERIHEVISTKLKP